MNEQKPDKLKPYLNQVLLEVQQAQMGTIDRQSLIREIETMDPKTPRRLVLYIANVKHPNSGVGLDDIVPIADALTEIGRAPNLDLMIHTLGGSGEVAEKIVEMCRSHCEGEFRVIIPNLAKSAGTLIALGADKIVMGHCSEVGPIDPQMRIMIGNSPQSVSAWTFVRARDDLQEKVKNAIVQGQNPAPFMQQLAAIDPVWVKHCEQTMEFAKRLGVKWIGGRLKNKSIANPETLAENTIAFLDNVERHITHGRLILATQLKEHCSDTLEIVELPEADPFWQKIWQLYVRCEVYLMLAVPGSQLKSKLIETAALSFTTT